MKTFKNFMAEVAEPLAGDEKKFKAKHTIQKVTDKGGQSTEDDKVFNATNVSRAGVPSEHAPGQDESVYEEVEQVDERSLTDAEMKKREQVVKAIKRENPKMDKSKAYAIATATAKKVAEEAEQVDEKQLHPNQKVLDVAEPKGKLTAADFIKLRKQKKVDEALDSEDWEGQMAKTELRAICDKGEKIISMLEDEDQLEAWVQSKISNAKMMIDSVHDYLNYKEDDKDSEGMENEAKVPNIAAGPGSLTVLGSKSVFEQKRGRPAKTEEDKEEQEASKNIVNQMRKKPVGDTHTLRFNNGKKADVHVKDVSKALSMLANTPKPADREKLQNSLAHSHDRFKETVKTGKAIQDPERPKVSLAKSVRESTEQVSEDVETYAADRRQRKAVTFKDPETGRIKVKWVQMPKKEIKVSESVEEIEEKKIVAKPKIPTGEIGFMKGGGPEQHAAIAEAFHIQLDEQQIEAIENALLKLSVQNQEKFLATAAESEEGSASMLDFALNIK